MTGRFCGVIFFLFMMFMMFGSWGEERNAEAFEYKAFTLHGFIQQGVSMNLQDTYEVQGDDKFRISMLRTTLYLDSNLDLDWVKFTAIARGDIEFHTSYMKDLNDLSTHDLWDEDGYNEVELREFYADFQIGSRLFLRLGKQQVVWGKTDYFRGIDIIHGFDYSWRSFLEPENEQLRKPLIMANMEIQIPEMNGTLQLIFRPGLDRDEDIGNTYDLFGGRWANQPNKGFNFFDVLKYNLDHSEGDEDDPTYGVRWCGQAFDIEYSLNYLKTFYNDPVVNPSPAAFGTPYKEMPKGLLGDLIFPQVDVAGVTSNYYVAPLDIIVRCEFAYTWDAPFNYGSNHPFGMGLLPGFAGIKEKDTLRSMIAFDRNVDFVKRFFKAERPGFFNLQVFDTWLVNYDRDDDIVALVGYGKSIEEHSTVITGTLVWNYMWDKINPGLAVGVDMQNGNGFVLPFIDFQIGNDWRLHAEADLFFNADGKKTGEVEDDAGLFDYFDNNNQFYVRLQYQF